ncbi:MAG: hypothetical protein SFW66_05945 [Gammaproteobacteria bacterium]|nr:hypothetical protein [Gammaproteobacteria bacterium]
MNNDKNISCSDVGLFASWPNRPVPDEIRMVWEAKKYPVQPKPVKEYSQFYTSDFKFFVSGLQREINILFETPPALKEMEKNPVSLPAQLESSIDFLLLAKIYQALPLPREKTKGSAEKLIHFCDMFSISGSVFLNKQFLISAGSRSAISKENNTVKYKHEIKIIQTLNTQAKEIIKNLHSNAMLERIMIEILSKRVKQSALNAQKIASIHQTVTDFFTCLAAAPHAVAVIAQLDYIEVIDDETRNIQQVPALRQSVETLLEQYMPERRYSYINQAEFEKMSLVLNAHNQELLTLASSIQKTQIVIEKFQAERFQAKREVSECVKLMQAIIVPEALPILNEWRAENVNHTKEQYQDFKRNLMADYNWLSPKGKAVAKQGNEALRKEEVLAQALEEASARLKSLQEQHAKLVRVLDNVVHSEGIHRLETMRDVLRCLIPDLLHSLAEKHLCENKVNTAPSLLR